MTQDLPQPGQIQTGSHPLGYHCSYHRDHKSALPNVVPAGEMDRIQAFHKGTTSINLPLSMVYTLFVPLKAHDPVHPSPDEGRPQTSLVRTTGQISGYEDGL